MVVAVESIPAIPGISEDQRTGRDVAAPACVRSVSVLLVLCDVLSGTV